MRLSSLGWEGPLEKSMATHSSIFAWRILWTEEPDRLTVHGVAELDTTERLSIAQGDGVGLSVTRSANGFKVLQ